MACKCLSMFPIILGILLISSSARSEGPVCTTVLQCAQIAADAATRAEAAAAAMRRPPSISQVIGARSFATIYQNKTGRTLIVVVTAYNNNTGNTMFGNIATTAQDLPLSGGVAANGSTTVSAAFINNTYTSNITIIVPPEYFYNVTLDGGNVTLTHWMEAAL